MKKIKTTLRAALATVTIGLPYPSHAFGLDFVIDVDAIAQAALTTAEEVKQTVQQAAEYALQGQQYVQQMKDAVAPAAYIFDEVTSTIDEIQSLNSTIDGYVNKYGDVEGYLSKFKDVSFYKDSPCFKEGGCSQDEFQELHDSIAFGSESQNESNSDFIRYLEQQQDALKDDAKTLEKLQDQAQDADGHMKALQAANQLASAQANQLLQLRSGFNSLANAIVQRQQALQQVEAQAHAAGVALRRDTTKIINSDNEGWGFK
jgi:type IV secretion system protein TrbJ